MEKIIFCNIAMKKELKSFVYKVKGDSSISYEKAVFFPINGVLARKLEQGDKVKVVLLKKEDLERNSDKNCEVFKQELDSINKDIGADIEYKVLSIPMTEDRAIQENILKSIVDELVEDALIYVDITFGTKSIPILVFSALHFAERFFRTNIENIVYGKIDFDNNGKQTNPELFDMSALFYLNRITNTIESKNSSEAKKMLNILLDK